MSVSDHDDLAAKLSVAMDTYGASPDGPNDRRTYYTERDAIFAEADRRDADIARRELLPRMPEEATEAILRGEQVWDTTQLTADFEVLGFAAPLVVVRRRSDGAKGSLKFTHAPRVYFGWEPA